MGLRPFLRAFIDVLEVRYATLPSEPKSSKLAESMYSAFLSKPARRRQDKKSSIPALEQLSSLVEDELRALRRAHNTETHTLGLPIEILVHIFRFASLSGVPPDWYDENEEVCDESFMRRTRTAITSTCSHWREVALNDSRLWRVIYLPWDLRPRYPPIYKCIDFEIERCNDALFSFKMQAGQNEIFNFALILQSNIHQIDDLDILTFGPTLIDSFLIFNEMPNRTMLKSLRRLCISSLNWAFPPVGEKIHLTSACSLKELRLENGFEAVDSDTLEPAPSWAIYPPASCVLETLYLSGWLRAESIIHLLNSATALRSFVWGTTGVEEEREIFFSRLEPIPTLQNLRMRGMIPSSWLSAIRAPNLDHLHLSLAYQAPSSAKVIPDVIFPKLTSLTIEGIDDASTIVRFLRRHPSLRVLELRAVKLSPELCKYLGSTKADENPLANLESLTFDFDFYEPELPDWSSIFEDILQSRSQAPLSYPPFMLHYIERDSGDALTNHPTMMGFRVMFAGMFDIITNTTSTGWEWPCW